MKMENNLSLSIVTYNSADEIEILIESLMDSNHFGKMDVYIIDNASSDMTVSVIKRKYPWVKLFENKENVGFGKAHNKIISNVHTKYHIIVNPDIQVNKDTFEKCIAYLEENEDVVVVTPLILNIDGTEQFLPKRNPSFKYMVGGLFDKQFKICQKIRDEYTLKNMVINTPIDVEFCSGCFMITRTSALHKVGGFDSRYFLHFEDADLTRKLKEVGRTVYNPDIVVTHKWQRDNKKWNKSFIIALKSMFIYLKKWG